MRVDVSFKYLERSEYLNHVLDKNVKKVERRIQIFKKGSPIHVSIHLEKNPHREEYFCRIQLYLPTSKVLVIQEDGPKAEIAIHEAFSGIDKQLEKLKYKVEKFMRKRQQRSKQAKKAELGELPDLGGDFDQDGDYEEERLNPDKD